MPGAYCSMVTRMKMWTGFSNVNKTVRDLHLQSLSLACKRFRTTNSLLLLMYVNDSNNANQFSPLLSDNTTKNTRC